MRDQQYHKRLNEIRQKYGYLKEFNPVQLTKERTPTKHVTPNHYAKATNGYNQRIEPSPKPLYLNNLYQQRSSPLVQKSNNNNYEYTKSLKKETNKGDIYTDMLQRQRKDRKSIPLANYSNSNDRNILSYFPSKSKNKENEFSPIRQLKEEIPESQVAEFKIPSQLHLQSEYSAKKTPSSIRLDLETMKKSNNERIDKIITARPQRSELDKNKQLQRRSLTPTARKNSPINVKGKTQVHLEQTEMNQKYNFSIQNIDKIQEKIQSMLKKNKK